MGFTLRDASMVARAVRHMTGDDVVDLRPLERDLARLLGEVGGEGMSPAVMSGVLATMERHDLTPPGAMVLLGRTLLTLEGTLRIIDPGFELARTANTLLQGDSREELNRSPGDHPARDHPHAARAALAAGPRRDGPRPAPVGAPGRPHRAVRGPRPGGGGRVGQPRAGGGHRRRRRARRGGADPCRLAHHTEGVRDTLWTLGFTGLTFGLVLLMRSAAQSLRRVPLRRDDTSRATDPRTD
jgi:hypothetical protein